MTDSGNYDFVSLEMSHKMNDETLLIAFMSLISEHFRYRLRSVAHLSNAQVERIVDGNGDSAGAYSMSFSKGKSGRTASLRWRGIQDWDNSSSTRFFLDFLSNMKHFVREGTPERLDGTRMIDGTDQFNDFLNEGGFLVTFSKDGIPGESFFLENNGVIYGYSADGKQTEEKAQNSRPIEASAQLPSPEESATDSDLIRSIRSDYERKLKIEQKKNRKMEEVNLRIQDTLMEKVDSLESEVTRLRALLARRARRAKKGTQTKSEK